jgi:alkylation response protein AidB-like acyl-CoA dehydrogenase
MERLAMHDLGPAIFVSVHAMVAGLIARFGTDDQKQSILPELASGAKLAAFALTEPHAGSDAGALSTEAVKVDGGYKLKGQKCYITSAGFADLYLVFARTAAESGSKISAFVVPNGIPGLDIGKPEKKMGCELSPIASMFFDDAFIPDSSLMGPLHGGFKVALSGLAGGRVSIAACANGVAAQALTIAVAHLKERKQFGQALIHFQGLQFMLADMHMKLEGARLLTRRGAEDIDAEKRGDKSVNTRLSSSTAKCFATDAAMSITTDAVQLLGGAGYIKEYTVEKLMRDAKMLQIVEGANQLQRMLIARELSGI